MARPPARTVPAALSRQAPTGAAPSNSLRQDRQDGCAGQDAQRCRCAAPPPAAGHARKRFGRSAAPAARPGRTGQEGSGPGRPRHTRSSALAASQAWQSTSKRKPWALRKGRASGSAGPPWISSSRIRSRPAWLCGGRHGQHGGSWERHGRLRAVTPDRCVGAGQGRLRGTPHRAPPATARRGRPPSRAGAPRPAGRWRRAAARSSGRVPARSARA